MMKRMYSGVFMALAMMATLAFSFSATAADLTLSYSDQAYSLSAFDKDNPIKLTDNVALADTTIPGSTVAFSDSAISFSSASGMSAAYTYLETVPAYHTVACSVKQSKGIDSHPVKVPIMSV